LGQADIGSFAGPGSVPGAARTHHGPGGEGAGPTAGFRTRSVVVVTTLLGPGQATQGAWRGCTGRAGTTNWACAPASRRCRCASCAARRRGWCAITTAG